jgi:thiol:disulfide interchange protein/DsbC/DsbD-like thiol-disulfide interchange protein
MNQTVARFGSVVLGLLLPWFAWGQAQSKVTLQLDKSEVKPGDSASVLIELRPPAGWHTYWRNPSEFLGVGIATKVKWTLPDGVTVGDLQWPVPVKLPNDVTGDTHVFEGPVRLVAALKIAPTAGPGVLEANAAVSWQECQSECVTGSTNVMFRITVGGSTTSAGNEAAFAAARAEFPIEDAAPNASAHWAGPPKDDTRVLEIEWRTNVVNPDFFAYESKTTVVLAKTERASSPSGGALLRKTVQKPDAGWPTSVSGLLVADSLSEKRTGRSVTLMISDGPAVISAAAPPVAVDWGSLASMLGLAFVGGLILNIMPCVLPVLALKILGFVRQSGSHPGQVRRLGLYYGAGVLTSFLILGLVSLAVQAAGGVAGWSTAFQNPQFRVGMCVLLVLVALNLFGVFEVTLSGGAAGAAGSLASKEGPGGAFFNGVLAAVLATPCTAPFLATAVAFAFTQPPLVLLSIFLTVGLGLASPFVVLCWKPAWLKLMPKPGDWMVRFKTIMGFPVLGTAVWIFWFTSKRMGESGVLWFGLFLVTVALAAWVWGEYTQRLGRFGFGITTATVLLVGGYFLFLEYEIGWRSPGGFRKPGLDWQAWSAAKVDAERAAGHPVLVDFTADNCANCKFNKATSIEISSTISKLKENHVTTLEGDFTDADPAIAEVLKQFGRRGVPLVVVYSKNPALPPKALPVTLTPSIVQEAIDWASK